MMNARYPTSVHRSSFIIPQVAFPQIDVDVLVRLGSVAPELAGVESHAVDELRVLAEAVGVGIWKNHAAVDKLDDAAFAAGVAGQPRMARRVEVARHHGIAWLEAGRGAGVATIGVAIDWWAVRRQRRVARRRWWL